MTSTLSGQSTRAPGEATKFFPSIQYLRAAAALLVVTYHVVNHWLPQYLAHDYVLMGGVDIFFVISGFVMWGVTAGREGGSWSFFSKRLKRIVPLYWIVTTMMLAIVLVKPALLNTRFDAAHVVTSYLFIPWRHPVGGALEPLLIPGWTLNYEMAFYVVFALILFVPIRFRLGLVVGVLVGIVALGFFAHAATGQLAFYTNPIVLEFAMGVCLGAAVTAQRRVPTPIAAAVLIAGIGLFITAACTGLLFHRALMLGIPATLLVAGCVFLERETGPRLAPLPLLLGDASYSIYLVHMGTALAAFQAWRRVDALHNPVGIVATMIVAALASVGAGVLVYWIVERPIVERFKARALKSRPEIDGSAIVPSSVDRPGKHANVVRRTRPRGADTVGPLGFIEPGEHRLDPRR